MNAELGPQVDAIVALGKNWARKSEWKPRADGKPRRNPLRLSMESKLTALAAGQLYTEGKAGCIIFSTGNTAGIDNQTGINYPTEAKAMAEYMKIRYPQISDKKIILEERSFDTAGNAEEVAKIVKESFYARLPIKEVAVLTVGFHGGSSRALFENYGLPLKEIYASEDIVGRISPRHNAFVEKYVHSQRYLVRAVLEFPRMVLVNTFDRRGKLLRRVTTVLRHQK